MMSMFNFDLYCFEDKTQTNIKCTSEVPGLPNSKMERTFQIDVQRESNGSNKPLPFFRDIFTSFVYLYAVHVLRKSEME